MKTPSHSNVLVVGAGSAGSVLADRLSTNPNCRITVIESGPGIEDSRVRAQIGNCSQLPIGPTSTVVRRYETTLTDYPPRSAQIVRGAVAGGSGAVNGGYFCRGLPREFEEWGLPGWAWTDLLDHFRAIENDLDFGGPLHGAHGPITVQRAREFCPNTERFINAAQSLGFDWIHDMNGSDLNSAPQWGLGAVPLNVKNGARCGPGSAFLEPAATRANLDVRTSTRAERIRIKSQRAVGVACVGPDGPVELTADRIVVCAGAIATAHLLMLSGIGDERDLRAVGVPVVVPLPVGTRCADHPEWILPLNSTATTSRPALEVVLCPTAQVEIRPYTAGFATIVGDRHFEATDRLQVGVALMRPQSRAKIQIVSDDPTVPPRIYHRYDSEPSDIDALRAGAELARDLYRSGGTVGTVGPPSWSTSQHLCASAPMGGDRDGTAVLDAQCRVRGIEGLWVVDGSSLPTVPGRGPHATILGLAHRAAALVMA